MEFEDHPDGIIIAGSDGRVEYVNSRILRMARADRQDIIGEHLSKAVPFDDLAGNSWFDVVRPYDGFAIRTRLSESSWYSPRGSEYLITASLVREKPAGRVVRVVMSVRNARIRTQRDRQRSDLVATVAHELRSPLTGIKGFASTMLSKSETLDASQTRLMLETIDSDADRLSRLIAELLDAARIDTGRLDLRRGPVKIADLVSQVLMSALVASQEPYDLVISDDVSLLWGDADRLRQVIANLIENANRHGRGLRRIEILNQVGYSDKPGVAVVVHDRGPGIPDEARQRVFSRFWRSGSSAGSGLGMYIVRGIVYGHGGTIEIGESEPTGARIELWLPINEPAGIAD